MNPDSGNNGRDAWTENKFVCAYFRQDKFIYVRLIWIIWNVSAIWLYEQ